MHLFKVPAFVSKSVNCFTFSLVFLIMMIYNVHEYEIQNMICQSHVHFKLFVFIHFMATINNGRFIDKIIYLWSYLS